MSESIEAGAMEEFGDDFDAAFAGEKLFFEDPGLAPTSSSSSTKARATSASHISSLVEVPEDFIHSSTFKKLPKGERHKHR